ncbi:hypothetical protein BKA67DRAFT_675002 [Truncatella angustata]|uniref:Uncharacterized protein n=1 Tax=Truncatella angustata TaxID=152316 RepID=A0A9P8UML5_9PEZI|nr:uncharacterized protein BKA67DRAFT_675002 [Truncatella angustata]KAH6654977.1 hypothetical protein BKA67DRAFT_675002 [Truncatella angustata]
MAQVAAVFLLLFTNLTLCYSISYPPLYQSEHSPSSPRSELNKCNADGYSTCGKGLPDDFCCPSGSTCLSIASNTTALCCPKGQDCSIIQVITCDIQQQNVTAAPESGIHTTTLEKSLPLCGIDCCPFGYHCNEDLSCELDKDVAVTTGDKFNISTILSTTQITTVPSSTSQTSSPTVSFSLVTTTIRVSLSTATSVTGDTPAATTEYIPTQSSNKTSIAVGSTIGAAGAVSAIGAVIYLCMRRRRTRRSAQIQKSWRRTWRQQRPQHDSGLTKFHTWRGQSYYAKADARPIVRVPVVPPEPVYYAELPATPLSTLFWDKSLPRAPQTRPQSTYKTYMGTKAGKSQDRWSLQ